MIEHSTKTENGIIAATLFRYAPSIAQDLLKVLPDAFDASKCWHVVNVGLEHLSRHLNEHLHRCRCSNLSDSLPKGRSGLRGTDETKARGRAARLWFESLTLMSVEQLLDAEGASQRRPLLSTCLAVSPDLA